MRGGHDDVRCRVMDFGGVSDACRNAEKVNFELTPRKAGLKQKQPKGVPRFGDMTDVDPEFHVAARGGARVSSVQAWGNRHVLQRVSVLQRVLSIHFPAGKRGGKRPVKRTDMM